MAFLLVSANTSIYSDVFTTKGDNLGHDSATFGAGLQAILSETLTASL